MHQGLCLKQRSDIKKSIDGRVWACDRFSYYILGRPFFIQTDHKPLVPILNTKNLDNLPPRVLRFQLWLPIFEYRVQHVPGKFLYMANALSRAPLRIEVSSLQLQDEVEAFIENSTYSLPAMASRLEMFKQAQDADPECSEVKKYRASLDGWHERKSRLVIFYSMVLVEFSLLILCVACVQLTGSFKIWPFWE